MKLMSTAVFVLLLPLGACAARDLPTARPGPSPALDSGVVDCGVHAIKQGDGLPDTAMACLVDAAAGGRQARLQETRPTIEGDPIFTWYVVRADGAVEVTRDTTQDNFGSGAVSTQTCTGPVADRGMLTFAECRPEASAGTPRR